MNLACGLRDRAKIALKKHKNKQSNKHIKNKQKYIHKEQQQDYNNLFSFNLKLKNKAIIKSSSLFKNRFSKN